jgi:two-component SAPR family response regulator
MPDGMRVLIAMNVAGPVTFASGAQGCVTRCLERFRVEDAGGHAIPIRTRNARAILAVLAASDRPTSRDMLADLLWSDRPPAQARRSLRQAIFELQHASGQFGFLAVARDECQTSTSRLRSSHFSSHLIV